MAVSSTSVNYTGRLKDLHISGNLKPLSVGEQRVTYSFGKVTRYIAGTQKLVQRIAIGLVNSGFAEELIGRSNSNVQTARNLFNLYKGNLVTKYRAYQDSQPEGVIPLDEQLDTIQLIDVTPVADPISKYTGLKFSAKVLTKAGDAVVMLLPLPLL